MPHGLLDTSSPHWQQLRAWAGLVVVVGVVGVGVVIGVVGVDDDVDVDGDWVEDDVDVDCDEVVVDVDCLDGDWVEGDWVDGDWVDGDWVEGDWVDGDWVDAGEMVVEVRATEGDNDIAAWTAFDDGFGGADDEADVVDCEGGAWVCCVPNVSQV